MILNWDYPIRQCPLRFFLTLYFFVRFVDCFFLLGYSTGKRACPLSRQAPRLVEVFEGVFDESRSKDVVVGKVRTRHLLVVPEDIRPGI